MEDKALKVFIAEASSLSLFISNHDKNQEAEKKANMKIYIRMDGESRRMRL